MAARLPAVTNAMASTSISDLVDHFRLDTQIREDCTLEIVRTVQPRGRRVPRTEKRWTKQNELGYGTFGEVWLEKDQKGETRAVKGVRKRKDVGIDYYKELLAMAKLSKHIQLFVELFGWYETVDSLFIAMEYFEHGDLHKYVLQTGSCSEHDAGVLAYQLLEGLGVMHDMGFAHRDLKPQNIFISQPSPDWWIKIGDFGITKRVQNNEETAFRTEIGTRLYRAPEVGGLIDDNSDEYTNAVDIWSLGCVVFWVLTQEVPFSPASKIYDFVHARIKFPTTPLNEKGVSPRCSDFLQRAIVVQPADRFTVHTALQDHWLTDAYHVSIEEESSDVDDALPNALKMSNILSGNGCEPSEAVEPYTGRAVDSQTSPAAVVNGPSAPPFEKPLPASMSYEGWTLSQVTDNTGFNRPDWLRVVRDLMIADHGELQNYVTKSEEWQQVGLDSASGLHPIKQAQIDHLLEERVIEDADFSIDWRFEFFKTKERKIAHNSSYNSSLFATVTIDVVFCKRRAPRPTLPSIIPSVQTRLSGTILDLSRLHPTASRIGEEPGSWMAAATRLENMANSSEGNENTRSGAKRNAKLEDLDLHVQSVHAEGSKEELVSYETFDDVSIENSSTWSLRNQSASAFPPKRKNDSGFESPVVSGLALLPPKPSWFRSPRNLFRKSPSSSEANAPK